MADTTAHVATDTAISIPNDSFAAPIRRFVKASALTYCCSVITDDGHTTVTPSWPVASFSTGEKALWGVLASLCSGDLRHVLDRCDVHNVSALRTVIDALAVS